MAVNLTGLYLLAYVGVTVGREQRRARDAAIRLSTIDSLTGLHNRSYFFTALEREIARGDRSGRAFCLVMLDLDDLKAVNDRFGHVSGDQVLRAVADIVRGGVRKIDTAARYGGDEFVALLPETDPTGGWVVAEKIRLTVAEQGLPGIDPGPTVSVGVVSYPADGRSADALLVSADRAMYASKRGGKNRVARAATEPMVLNIEPIDAPAGRKREGDREGERAG
jgi:diguanylate cyclase (GGDEF)-like protein